MHWLAPQLEALNSVIARGLWLQSTAQGNRVLQRLDAATRGQAKSHRVAAQGLHADMGDESQRLKVALHVCIVPQVGDAADFDVNRRETTAGGEKSRIQVGSAIDALHCTGEFAAATLEKQRPAHAGRSEERRVGKECRSR